VETRRRIEEAIEEYLRDYSRVNKGARSHDEDQRTLNRFKELLSVTSLNQICPKHCQEYVARRKETVSNARINREINALKAFFTRAHKWGWIPASPAADLPHLPEVKSRRARYLTEEEIGLILEAVAGTDLEGLVLLALNLGLRVGELCNLTWKDIDFQNHLLHVTAKPDWQPKGYQERSLELNAPTLTWLRQEHARDVPRLSPYVFPVRQGPKPGSRIGGMLVTRLSRLMRKLGIANGGFHLLRHSFASYQMMADADPKTLQEALGHSQLKTMEKYIHLKPSHRSRITQRVQFGRPLSLGPDHLIALGQARRRLQGDER
jgi:integrase/recombinase XerC